MCVRICGISRCIQSPWEADGRWHSPSRVPFTVRAPHQAPDQNLPRSNEPSATVLCTINWWYLRPLLLRRRANVYYRCVCPYICMHECVCVCVCVRHFPCSLYPPSPSPDEGPLSIAPLTNTSVQLHDSRHGPSHSHCPVYTIPYCRRSFKVQFHSTNFEHCVTRSRCSTNHQWDLRHQYIICTQYSFNMMLTKSYQSPAFLSFIPGNY